MEGGDDKNGSKNKFSIIDFFCSLVIHYFDMDSEDSNMPCNVMAHFNKFLYTRDFQTNELSHSQDSKMTDEKYKPMNSGQSTPMNG